MASKTGTRLIVLVLLAMCSGCISATKAIPIASYRSNCEEAQVAVVHQDGHDVWLNVCGSFERWRWSAFDGWTFVHDVAARPVLWPATRPSHL